MKNKQFVILEAIAIILIVAGHKGGIPFLHINDFFSLYGYHVALFIFISGYFFKIENTQHIPLFIWNKTKKLLIPYFGWNIIYACIASILQHRHTTSYFEVLTNIFSFQKLFIQPWTDGHQYYLNLATWFVTILFLTQVIYTLLQKYTKKRFNSEWLQILLLVIGLISVYVSNSISPIPNYLKPILKVSFFLPFYHFGYYYRTKLETKASTIPNTWFFLLLFLIQYDLYSRFGAPDYYLGQCNYKQNLFIPFISSFVGILFWLRISRILVPLLGNNKYVHYIGNNTWSIMVHHLFVFFLINLSLKHIRLDTFNNFLFRTDFWYSCPSVPYWLYVGLGIILPIIWQQWFNIGKNKGLLTIQIAKSKILKQEKRRNR